MLAEIGRDCAGAVSFLPEAPKATEAAEEPSAVAWLSDDELEELVGRQPPPRLFDPASEQRMRASLAGERHKLALVREKDGDRWGWPTPELPSTHILKPESGEYPDLVANEMFCMAVAGCAGEPVAHTELQVIAGRPCIVSQRFDRAVTEVGAERIHQEDFCQALGFAAPSDVAAGRATDEEADGPDFGECCGLLGAIDRRDHLPFLLGAAVCNYALGNGDAHGKNFALLYDEEGGSLAPFYDISSTVVYDLPIHTGMVLAAEYAETAYLLEMDIICEACDFDLDRFRVLVAATAARIEGCLEIVAERARREGWHAPVVDEIAELAGQRARGLGFEVEY